MKDEFIDTKIHILRAGKELLLAAQGVLSFCQHYIETSSHEKRNPELAAFFSKALSVIQSLSRDLKSEKPMDAVRRSSPSRTPRKKKKRPA
ncbi:MAG: hypothetical protein A3I05_01550 [Deltaproteobacteria bacterium RIFCSPLOWO2_02_FULL_44_10]|nr:MAG: hypothetical protein A3C46_05145 [Deltaproteobacteria bacterium RIFCSPHIGHO2_02_FULL_44_16]OGQ45336.1 MAG: hypothetical protein A3I05_01550 [Deltaproteobacteria bacterium RIFCSPLOWO2_02_FULL_44_10]